MFDMLMVVKSKETVEPAGTCNIRLAPMGFDQLEGSIQAQMEIKLSGLDVEAAAKYEIGKQISVTAKLHF